MWSYVWLVFSVDLLIVHAVNAWTTHCQKLFDVEQLLKLRTTHRWGLQTVQQSIHRFRTELSHTSRWSLFRGFHPITEAHDSVEDKWHLLTHQLEANKLPPYYQLCFMVQHEVFKKLQYLSCFWLLSLPISYIVAFSGVGQLCSIVGRKHWGIAIWKYYLFLCVCLGFWTDETYDAYEVEDLVKKFTILDPDEATILFIPLVVASRVILLQVLGNEAFLISIIVINLCGSPLLVFSPKMQKVIPPLIYWSPREVALKRETIELLGRRDVQGLSGAVHMQEWVLAMRSASIVLTESRLVVFFANLVSLSLAVFLLQGVTLSATYLALCLLAMFPYFVGSALLPIIYIGKRLNLTDDDFRAVLPSWLVGLWVRLAELCWWLRSQLSRLVNFLGLMSVRSLLEVGYGSRRVATFPETNEILSQEEDSLGDVGEDSLFDCETCDGQEMIDEVGSDVDYSIPDVSEEDMDDERDIFEQQPFSELSVNRSLCNNTTMDPDDVSVNISYGSIDVSDVMESSSNDEKVER